MPSLNFHFPRLAWLGGVLVLATLPGCKPPPESPREGAEAPAIHADLLTQLAGARIDAARMKLADKQPGEALTLLVSALKADPTSEEARALAETILKQTVWNLPTLALDHRMPIDQIALAGNSLWVSLGGAVNTTLRWELEALRVEGVLFPVRDEETRSLSFDAGHRWAVVERGPVSLLCDARTLKPVRDLGPLPEFLTPSAAIAFSPDGLLLAHPVFVSEEDRSLVWHLRDSASGQIIRSAEPLAADAPPALAAFLDREKLRVIHADGSLLEMPVNPLEPELRTPLPEPARLLHAQFSSDGNAVLSLIDLGPHEPPQQSVISYQDADDGSLAEDALARRFPWSRHPTLWSALAKDPQYAPFAVDGSVVKLLTGQQAPIESASPVAALAFGGNQIAIGGEDGTVILHRLLPLPGQVTGAAEAPQIQGDQLTALAHFATGLAGLRYDEKSRSFTRVATAERIESFHAADPEAVRGIFPQLDFAGLIAEFKSTPLRSPAAEAYLPLWDRLARADASGKSWPELLEFSENLLDTTWRGESARISTIFDSGDSAAILSAIESAGGKGPAAAAALALALQSERPEWIEASLAAADKLPPLLGLIARSRIAWLQDRKAEALSPWPEIFPDLAQVRLREDWDGWEQADFAPALEQLRSHVLAELAAIEVPENSTPEQRQEIAVRLLDPATLASVGPRRFGQACLKAALAFSSHKEQADTSLQLATLARDMGAPAAECLRAEALALTALGDFEKAHPRWIELITEHPVTSQIPGDYAEAAYTAFENSDPRQAMEILTTGLHRFPDDGNFALRAGWVALLTGNSERAYQFLLAGKRIGFPAEKLENAMALLTIAAEQSGANDDASVYFNDLLAIDPAWADPETIETLPWPEELKWTLRQFSR
jgi:tetratricopeptide (TPR) repeat protein